MQRRFLQETVVRWTLTAAASTSILIVVLIFAFLGKEAVPFVSNPGLGELLEKRWVPVSFQRETYGLVPLVAGSLLVTILAILIATPFGVCGAVYISEIARPREREILKPFVEILAGIPTWAAAMGLDIGTAQATQIATMTAPVFAFGLVAFGFLGLVHSGACSDVSHSALGVEVACQGANVGGEVGAG